MPEVKKKVIPKTDARIMQDWRGAVAQDNTRSNRRTAVEPIAAPVELIRKNIRAEIDRKHRLVNPTTGDRVSDIGTQITSGLKTFGGSVIGNAINDVSPKAATAVSKYTAGLIAPTTQEDIETGRFGAPLQKLNMTAEAAGTAVAGEIGGALMNYAGKKIAGKMAGVAIQGSPATKMFDIQSGYKKAGISPDQNLDIKSTINLSRTAPKTKPINSIPSYEENGLKIKLRGKDDYGTRSIHVSGNSGKIEAVSNGDGSYGFHSEMSNPFEAGKSMIKIGGLLPKGAAIHEKTSLSLDSYSNIMNLAKKGYKLQDAGYIPLNFSAKNNTVLQKIPGFKPTAGYANFNSREEALSALKIVDDFLLKKGVTRKADIKPYGDGQFYGIHIPNFKAVKH